MPVAVNHRTVDTKSCVIFFEQMVLKFDESSAKPSTFVERDFFS